MKLEFKINKLALIRSVFVSNNYCRKNQKRIPFPFWIKLENHLWEKFRDNQAYYFINPIHLDWALDEITIEAEEKGLRNSFLNIAEKAEKIYKEIEKTKEFKRLLAETKKYKNFVENQWKKNEHFVLDYIKNTLGLKIPNYTIKVYIFHPKMPHGKANFYSKTIAWGHTENWENYSTVYLCHELMHILTSKRSKNAMLMHAIIELAIDNELRIRLNKKGQYFKENNISVGHESLRTLEKFILPQWRKFLKNQDQKGSILKFEAIMLKKARLFLKRRALI
jgi:hypothetical protein